MSNHQPLKITFELATPMAEESYPIHLDSIIAFCKVQQDKQLLAQFKSEEDFYSQSLQNLPLTKDESGVWQASKLFLKVRGTSLGTNRKHFFVRRTEIEEIAMRREWPERNQESFFTSKFKASLVDTSRKMTKNHLVFYPIRDVETAVAYCIGDKAAIEELLTHLNGVGKYVNRGHGKIVSINVEVNNQANDLWKLRAMPYQIEGYEPIEMAITPPYFDKTNRVIGWIPSLSNKTFFEQFAD